MFQNLRLAARIRRGARVFEETGRTPSKAYVAMRRLFHRTNGESHRRWLARINERYRSAPVPRWEGPSPTLGLTPSDVEAAAGTIDRVGFVDLGVRLSPAECDALTAFALETPCVPRLEGRETPVCYDREHPIANIYDFAWQDVIANERVQRIATDPALLALAQQRIGPSAQLQSTALWWTNAGTDVVDADKAAQMYHCDLDHFKWLNFFFYLTDVDAETGPHVFVEGTHRPENRPEALQRDGRYSDEDIARHVGAGKVHELTGPRGTLLAVDTMGYHKGKRPTRGERLILQIRFACSFMGMNYDYPHFDAERMPVLGEAIERYGRAYADAVGGPASPDVSAGPRGGPGA